MGDDDNPPPSPHGGREPATFAVVLAITATVALGAAEGAVAKLLAVPLALVVAGAVVLASRRSGRRLDIRGHDRLLAVAVVLGALLAGAVVATSLSSDDPSPTVFVVGTSAGGAPAPGTASTPREAPAAIGGYAPSNRRTYECSIDDECDAGVNHVVFNSYTNAPNYGDERSFFDAKAAGNTSPNGWKDVLDVNPGDLVEVRIYIHNNADAVVARGTRLRVLLPHSRDTRIHVTASIEASNARPTTVSDTVTFRSNTEIGVRFDMGHAPQVTHRAQGTQPVVTKTLPSTRFSDDATLTAELGLWKPGFERGALITATARIT